MQWYQHWSHQCICSRAGMARITVAGVQIPVKENISRYNQPPRSTQPSHPQWVGANEYWQWSINYKQGRKRQFCVDSRSCNRHCWHTGGRCGCYADLNGFNPLRIKVPKKGGPTQWSLDYAKSS